jgi:hypothetical protein
VPLTNTQLKNLADKLKAEVVKDTPPGISTDLAEGIIDLIHNVLENLNDIAAAARKM